MTITRTSSKSLFGNLRTVLLEAFLFDSIIQDVLLQVLSIDAPTLEVSCFLKSLVKVLTFLQLKVLSWNGGLRKSQSTSKCWVGIQ